MGALLIKVAFLGLAACVGAIVGWLLRGAGQDILLPEDASQPNANPAPAANDTKSTETEPEEPDYNSVDLMMAQLQQLTSTVAADVGEHSSKVQEINEELTAATADGSNVLAVVEKLVQANEAMQSQLEQAEQRLNDQAQEIESHVKEARTDALTKAWNRRYFDDEMQKCKQALADSGTPSCVMMMDVDHFKKFNDTYGHQAGDEVLKGVARTLKKAAGKFTVCRYGGEEFAIIFPGAGLEEAIPIGDKARAAISQQIFEFEGLDLKVSASGGLAQLQFDERPEEAVKRADDSLYVAKENGRNCGYWHDGNDSHPMKDFQQPVNEEPTPEEEPQQEETKLTAGLSDRSTFEADVDRRIAECTRMGTALSVLVLEIDRYDAIIKAYGADARNAVAETAAKFLRGEMRDMDHIAMLDENQFGMLLPGTEVTESSSVAERLRTTISRCTMPLNGEKVTFTVSIGTAEFKDLDDHKTLLARADKSLSAAKQSGGNCSLSATADGDIRSMAMV